MASLWNCKGGTDVRPYLIHAHMCAYTLQTLQNNGVRLTSPILPTYQYYYFHNSPIAHHLCICPHTPMFQTPASLYPTYVGIILIECAAAQHRHHVCDDDGPAAMLGRNGVRVHCSRELLPTASGIHVPALVLLLLSAPLSLYLSRCQIPPGLTKDTQARCGCF